MVYYTNRYRGQTKSTMRAKKKTFCCGSLSLAISSKQINPPPPFSFQETHTTHKIARFRKLKMDYSKLTVTKLKDELKKRGLETDVS